MLQEAVQLAEQTKVVVLFVGLPAKGESERFDRENRSLPQGQLRLIEKVTNVNNNVVVVLFSGCVVECGWADSVKAVLYMGLPGQAEGEVVADLL